MYRWCVAVSTISVVLVTQTGILSWWSPPSFRLSPLFLLFLFSFSFVSVPAFKLDSFLLFLRIFSSRLSSSVLAWWRLTRSVLHSGDSMCSLSLSVTQSLSLSRLLLKRCFLQHSSSSLPSHLRLFSFLVFLLLLLRLRNTPPPSP